MDANEWQKWISAAGSPAVALMVAVVVYRQYRVSLNRLKLDLWEKRYAIFVATMELLDFIKMMARCRDLERNRFLGALKGREFLFRKDVNDYLDSLHDKAVDLLRYERELDIETGLPSGPERDRVIEENAALLKWFLDQDRVGAKAVFDPYLAFGKIR